MRSIRGIAVAVALALGAPAPALAQGKPDRATQQEANRHFKLGVAHFGDSKYREALAEFERAYSLAPHPAVLYNLAACHRALSQYGPAVRHYNRFIKEGAGQVDRRLLDKGKRELAELMTQVALVEVATQPAGATLQVDGELAGIAPLAEPLVLAAGEHAIEAALDGYRPLRRQVRVASGDKIAIDLALERIPDTPAPQPVQEPGPEPEPEPEVTVEAPPAIAPARARRFGLSAAIGTNAIEMADTGAPVVGLAFAAGSRLALGLDVVLVAYAAIPNLRVRLAGDALSVHAVAALPVSFTDGDGGETFVAGAAGLGLRWRAAPAFALRLESWVSVAGGGHGTTVPTFAGAELWF